MEDTEIEYLEEYKDYVLPGIKTSGDGRAATASASLDVASRRRRISSDSSGSSSIDPDIFQKLFDGKFLDDELNTESSSNAKGKSRIRRRLSSYSSDSNDAFETLYNQRGIQANNTRRERLESYDSIDDLGAALMGATPQTLTKKANSQPVNKSVSGSLQRGGSSIQKSAKSRQQQANKSSLSAASLTQQNSNSGFRANGSSSSSSSNAHVLANKKKAVTIIKAQKPDLNPPKHEPKEDPLHLKEYSDDADSDMTYTYEYESDFYGYGGSDDDDEQSKQVIDISTDSNAATSLADTVTPVVSDDESQQQQRSHTPLATNERLQLYLNNLSSAETPPSKNKHSNDRKSRSNEKPTSTTPTKAATEPLTDKNNDDSVDDHVLPMVEKPQLESGPSTSSLDRPRRDSETLTHAAVADVNLTYESLERVSLNLAEQIINIDMERSIEFEKRSGSKSRSTSASKSLSNTFGSQSHVRKLTYSNEKLNEIGSPMRRVKSAETFSKCSVGRPPKNRAATTEEDSKSSAVLETNNLTAPSPVAVAVAASPSNVTQQEPMKEDEKSTKKEKKVKKKRGRKKKEKSSTTTNCDSILQNQTSLPLPEINDQAEISNHAATCDALEIDTTSQLNKENEEEPVLENLEINVNDSSAEADAVAVAMAEAENAKIAEPEFPTTELTSTMAEIQPEDSFVGTVDNVEAAISAIHSENETEVEQVVEARHVENSVAQCETAVRSNSNEIDSRGEFDNSVELNVSNVCTELNEQKENEESVEQIQEILPNTEEVTETVETLKADLTETVVETVINNQAEDNLIIEATPKKILHTAQKATTSSIKRLSLRSASVMASPLPENKSTPSGRTSRSGGRRVLEETPQRSSSSRRSDRSPFSSDSSANAKGKKSVIPSEVAVAAETPRTPTVERPLRSSKPSTSAAAAATQQVEKEKSDETVHKHSKKSNASKTPKADKDAKSAKDRKSRSKGRKSKKVNQTEAEAAPPAIIQETIPESLIEPNTEVTNSALPTEIVAGTSEESQTELSNIALPTEIIASANEESRMEILNSSLPTEIIAGAYEESQLEISTEEPQTELITSSLPTEIIEGANELPLTELSNYSLPNEIFVETNDESHTELSNSAFSNESIAGTSVGSQMDLSNSVMPTMTTDVFDEVNQDNTQAPEIVEQAIGEESHIEVNTEVLSSAMQTEILVETKDDTSNLALPSEIIEEPKQDEELSDVHTEVVNAMDIEVPLTTDAQREGVPTVEELTAQDVSEQNLPKPDVNETVAEMVTVMEPREEQVAPSTSTANEASLESAKPTAAQQVPLDGESTRRLTRSRTETPIAVPPKRARSKKSKSKGKDKNSDETATNLKPPSTVKEQTSTEANKSEIAKETPSDTNNAPTLDFIEQPTNVQTNIDIQQSNETVHIKKRNTRNAKARNAASSTPDAIVAETPESILPSSTPSVGSSQGSLRNAKAKNAASSSLATASDAIVAETPTPAQGESSSILPSSTPSISSSQGSRLREVRVLIKRLPKSKMEEAQTKKEKNSENLGTEQALTNPTDQLAATPNDVEAQVETYPTQPPVNGNQEILPNLAPIDTAPIEMLTSEEQPPVEVIAQVDKPEKVVESKEEKDAPKRGVESKEEKDAPKSKRKRNTANSEKNQMGETSSSESKSQRKRSRRKKQEETPKPTETPTDHQPSTSTSESKSAQVEPQVGIEQQSCEAQTTANEEHQLIEKQLEEMEKDDDAAVPAAAQDTQEQLQANEEKADAQADQQLSDIMENAAGEDSLSVIQEPQQPDNETVEQQQQETEESVAAEESSSSQVETVNQEQQQPENQELETESEVEKPTTATAATASATAATDTAAADEIQTESQESEAETQEEVKQPDEEDETAAVQDQQITESHEIEQTEENEAQLESTETTGVITGVDEGGNVEGSINSMDVDATQPDESIKRKMQGKQQKHATSSGIMAPPAPPKRDPSPSKAVRRRQANPPKIEVQPTQKRRKLHDTVVEYNVVQSSRNQETTIETVVDKMPAAKATTTRKSPMPNKTKKSLVSDAAHPIGTMIGKKTTKGTKTPPPKTSLTSLLSPDEPLPAVDNSVIITKTSVKNATAEPPTPKPTAAASGINISVSVMPEPQTSPKKTLTQAETVKRLISLKGKKLISPQTAPAAAGATAASSTNQKTSPASAATTVVKTSTASPAATVVRASSAAATVAKSKAATAATTVKSTPASAATTNYKTLPASPAATVVKTSSASAAATVKSMPASAATRSVKPSPASAATTVAKPSPASAATTTVKASPASAATKVVKSSSAATSTTVTKPSPASTTVVKSSPATAATKVVKSSSASTSATVDKSSSASATATVDKSLPAAAVKASNARKSLPAKIAAPQTSVPSGASTSEEARKMLEKSTTTPSNKKLESKPATSTSAVANRKSMPAKKMDATANNPSTSKEINKPAVAPAAATVDTAAASASKKTASKTPSKAKSKELLRQATSVPEVPETTVVATTIPTPETKQKAGRAATARTPTARTPTVVKRDTAAATLAAQPTQQQQQQQPKRSVSNERQQTTMTTTLPETETQLQLQPKPQRQPRRPAKKAVAQTQDEAAAPTEAVPLPEPHATRKRKAPSKFDVETFEVKRRKQQQQQQQSEPAKNDTNVAFPVLITAASALPPVVPSAIVAAQAPVSRASSLAAEPRASSQAKKPLQLPPQPLPPKMRKLRVRLNRSIVKNWIKAQQQQQQQKQQPAATVNVVATAALSAPRGSPAPIRRGARLPAAKAVPLPVPMPVLEVKCEQEELLVPQPVAATVAQTPMDVDVDSPVQVAAAISVDSSTTATPSSSSISSAAIPSASSSANIPNSIGNTKVYSYLYPTRCQRNFGAVGLDFCCPNLDGPMEAIDPTRLHAVVKAPVLELPQYLVITTKIVSEQDKNIPQKVRAKLEQLAAKDGLPKIVTTTTTTTATPTPSIAPVAAAVAPPPPPAIPSVTPVLDRYNKKLPRGTTLTPKVHLEAAPAVPTPPPAPSTVASLLAETIAPPELLQLPPICPGDKQRMELQTRVEHLDAVVQSLVKRASTLTVTEREQVIERIVKTSTLEPIDVIVATKLLENYVRYINAVTDTVTAPPAPPSNAVFRSVVTPVTTPSTSAPTSAVSSSSGSSSSITQPALSVSLEEPPATIIMRPPVGSSTTTTVTASAAKSKDRRPIYDKQRNVIGYQYKSTLSKAARQPAAPPSSDTSNSGSSGSTSRSSLPVAASTPTPVATVTAQQQPRTRVSLTQSASSSSKVAVVGSAPKTRSVAGSSVLPLKPTTTPSDNTKRFPQRKSAAAAAKAPTAPTAKEKATPVGVVSGVPILNAATNPATNQNVIIVNQLLSQSEECILPDAIGGMVVAPAEIKGEVDDGEIIT